MPNSMSCLDSFLKSLTDIVWTPCEPLYIQKLFFLSDR